MHRALTLGAAQSRVTNARVLVASKMKKSATVISVQEDAFVDHSFNNVCDKAQITNFNLFESNEQSSS